MTAEYLAEIAKVKHAREYWEEAWLTGRKEKPDFKIWKGALEKLRAREDQDAINWVKRFLPPDRGCMDNAIDVVPYDE